MNTPHRSSIPGVVPAAQESAAAMPEACASCGVHRAANLKKLGVSMETWDFVVALAGNPNTGKSTVFNALTGLDLTEDQARQACERIYHVERAYLVRNGIRRKDDTAPHHFFDVPVMSGPGKGKQLDREKFAELMDVWYDLRGQDRKTAAPKRETLEALGLKNVADDLEKTGVYQE